MKNKCRESRDLNHAHLPCEEFTVSVDCVIVTVYPFLLVGSSLVRYEPFLGMEILSVQLTVLSILKNYILLLVKNLNIVYKCDIFV